MEIPNFFRYSGTLFTARPFQGCWIKYAGNRYEGKQDWLTLMGYYGAICMQLSEVQQDLLVIPGGSYGPGVSEIIFEVREDEADGGYVATALGHAIATQGETVEEIRQMVRDAVQCHFGDTASGEMPSLIRLHFVRDEVLVP